MVPIPDLLFLPKEGTIASMELLLCVLGFMAIFSLCLFPGGVAWARTRPKSLQAIPGPSGFPLTGLINVFTGSKPHRVLSTLAETFKAKPLMAFSLGLTRFVISSDPDTAKEILNSSAFADRPVKESAYELFFHRAMGFAPYGEYWRNLRRISATHLFSPLRITYFEPFRREIGLKMVGEVMKLMKENGNVEVKKVLHFGSLNNVMKTVFGRSFDFGGTTDGNELEELVNEGYELLGVFNWGDHLPVLRWLDFQGVRRRCRCLASKVNVFVGKIIEEHRAKRTGGVSVTDGVGDFVDVLLDLEKDYKLADLDMVAILWELIFRGTDTVAILLEWVLARMVIHQDIQAKVQAEIDSVVESTAVTGSDIPKLPFLQAIVKETLRVHPPGPLLSWARLAINDVHVGGNIIPAGTTAMVNMWSITHDEKVWAEPERFNPERFMAEGVSVMGSDLRLAPFGSGRRVCPGKALGLATVHLWLAQLLQSFNWLPCIDWDGDLTERLKLSMEMEKPLVCRAIPRAG